MVSKMIIENFEALKSWLSKTLEPMFYEVNTVSSILQVMTPEVLKHEVKILAQSHTSLRVTEQ